MCVPSGNEKFDTHLWSSSSLEHLSQIQEICNLSSQVVKCKHCKCGYLDKAILEYDVQYIHIRHMANMTSSRCWRKFALSARDLISHSGVHNIFCNFLRSSSSEDARVQSDSSRTCTSVPAFVWNRSSLMLSTNFTRCNFQRFEGKQSFFAYFVQGFLIEVRFIFIV